MSLTLRTPTSREVDKLARTLVAAKVFADEAELRDTAAAEPWRLLVNDRGDVAVLGRWRDHLPVAAIDALWCPWSGIAQAVRQIKQIAADHGFTDVVSPPVPIEERHPYEGAGMHPYTTVMTMVRSGPIDALSGADDQVEIRAAGCPDLATLLAVDAACFEPFWRYDSRHLARFCASGRLALAERDGEAVGYTLCTVDGDEGLLGRLCVVPKWRQRGVGLALVREAVGFTSRHGAGRTTLSTQVDNEPSQALYEHAGFRDTGRRYAFLRFDASEG